MFDYAHGGLVILFMFGYTGFLIWVRSRVRRGRSKAWGIRWLTGALMPIVIVVTNFSPHSNLPFTSSLSTFGRPHAKDVLTAERTVELFQEYNDAIVQTIHSTEEFRSETGLRMMLLGMMIAFTFGAGLEMLADPQSTPPSSPTDER